MRKAKQKKKVVKKNTKRTSAKQILKQMAEPRPLPMGKAQFDEWSDRIISGALIPDAKGQVLQLSGIEAWYEGSDYSKHYESQRYALAQMIMHLGPTESHKPDAFFIHQLRKGAVNQVAYAVIQEIKAQKEARVKAEMEALENMHGKEEEDCLAETMG